MNTVWFVSRQCYWPDGENVVEIAAGGVECANPDMLSDDPPMRKLGSGQEYDDPRDAVETAIKVRDAWQEQTDDEIRIEHGFTAGMTMPFCSHPTPTDEQLREWAEEAALALEKCEWCGDIIKGEATILFDYPDWKFCSEYCADRWYWESDDHVESHVIISGCCDGNY